jgi:hypothetical protein
MMLPNAFTRLSSLHKTLRSDGKSSFLIRKTDEKTSSVAMKVIVNITSKKVRREGMQSLDNVQMVSGKNWKQDLKLYLLLLLFLLLFHIHLHDLFLLSMQMIFPQSGT